MTEIREIALQFPVDAAHCNLIADQLVAAGFHELARQLRIAVKQPRVAEPEDFGSVVMAGIDGLSDRVLWLRSASGYWFSETSRRATFSDFHEPEVLRVGVGDEAAYNNGVSDTVSALVARLLEKHANTDVTLKRAAYREAIKTVEAL